MLEAKPGKQEQVAELLNAGLSMVAREPGTLTWYAFRVTDTTFGIYDTFHEDGAREEHLSGDLAEALSGVSTELLAAPPDIRPVEVLAAKPSLSMGVAR